MNPAGPRHDAAAKIDGSHPYANDLEFPEMLHGATVRSPHARARILGVDASAALALPGVVCVLTAADVPGSLLIGHISGDQPVFASDVVRHHGEPVAFVVAGDQEAAWEAASLVHVAYEPLPPLDDPERALDADAPLLHPTGNAYRRVHVRRNDPAVAGADGATPGADDDPLVVVRGTWWTGRQDQLFLAPESAVAVPDPDGAGVTLHLATQDLHTDRHQVASALGMDEERVRLVLAGVGGAFGGREDITLQVHLAMAALRTGRPVKTTYRRDESFLAHPKRHPARLRYELAATRDGTLRRLRADVLLDGGAYASTSGPVLGSACAFAAGPYRIPDVEVTGVAVATNNPVSGAMRGFGAVQACFGIESTMDLLAEALGMDPVELRRRNALRPGDAFPTTGQRVTGPAPVLEVIDRCAALPMPSEPPAEGFRRGVGFAVGVKNHLYGEGMDEWAVATVRIDAAGAEVVSAATECGQGIGEILRMLTAEVLGGMPVRLAPATTDAGYAGSSSASRATWMSGGAVRLAAAKAAQQLITLVADRTGVDPAAVRLRHGCVEAEGRCVDLASVLGDEVVAATATYRAPRTERGDATGQGDLHVSWMFVAHRAVVDVDPELGLCRVVQVATAQDVGRALHPGEVLGQIHGGISQGVGLALMEDLQSCRGVVRNAGLTDYLVPTAVDMPEVVVDLVEQPDPRSPHGGKGVGEPPSLSSTAAVAAAVRAATGHPVPRVPVAPHDLVG